MIHAHTIQVIIGSTRAARIGPQVAAWVAEIGRRTVPANFDLVDLRDWPLPMDDEPGIPATGAYTQPHTQAWGRQVAQASGFVFVTPQYNWGYPAALKNALDHLYREWSGKPAVIVTYGGRGGDKCAGQLRQVLDGLHMRAMDTMPGLRIARERIEANDGQVDPAQDFAAALPELDRAFAELAAAMAP
ncbi:NAD(P)H-dependent oxidoreductase [Acidisoma cellulosilytica]|uniref:NAD(P)H-dependent oxidoreductase n=1 Tax=Acidisoma cellulosilyticum TaxID=2802395 RepID=A0A963Z0P1_9PROT|nr:NAD(P)H-dependent oxidoreductase [Acidisoma cellulosilyticum]MCB8880663.1 NAD(P)H-dependent oxidoreductase [Acidisoma cellulosilyticum]